MKLQSTTNFVLNIRNRTTTELCEYLPNVFTAPKWKGSQGEMVKDMLAFDAIKFRVIGEHAKFMKNGLNKGMFIPCDLEGNVLSEPKCQRCYTGTPDNCHSAKECVINETPFLLYKQAKERVLFKDVELINNLENAFVFKIGDFEFCFADTKTYPMILVKNRSMCTIEQFANYIYDYDLEIELTESAIKQIGL